MIKFLFIKDNKTCETIIFFALPVRCIIFFIVVQKRSRRKYRTAFWA